MRTDAALGSAPIHLDPDTRLSRTAPEMVCALIGPPALTLAVGWLIEFGFNSEPGLVSEAGLSQVLIPVILGGMTVVSVVIAFDCWLNDRHGRTSDGFRGVLAISTCVALIFLFVWVTAQAERNRVSYAGELVVFMCLPVLLVCAPFLWYSIKALRSTAGRWLALTVFISACALVELHSLGSDYRNSEEKLFMEHSWLIAVALALRLVTWWHSGNAPLSRRPE